MILGAGASLAAFPNGDKNGRKIPLMNNIIEVINLAPLLDTYGITGPRDNFEILYSDLVTSGRHPDLVSELDRVIFDYFAALELPDEPTLYDHLVMSLRSKDLIVTFNWDPFIVQALARCVTRDSHRKVLFLHGNTAVGYCMRHAQTFVGRRGQRCSTCGELLTSCRLLYPVGQKNYNADPFIAKSWELLKALLGRAYLVTIFGYSAPVTDVEAIDLLKNAWGDPNQRVLEEIEIIDVKDRDTLYDTWQPFIHSYHFRVTSDFYKSSIGYSPRRSCEAVWMQLMEVEFIDPNPIPKSENWDGVRRFYDVLIRDEQ